MSKNPLAFERAETCFTSPHIDVPAYLNVQIIKVSQKSHRHGIVEEWSLHTGLRKEFTAAQTHKQTIVSVRYLSTGNYRLGFYWLTQTTLPAHTHKY